ncbi:sodium:solute symporter family protein [Rhodotorula paludigena]|uniref:sodium:solute symporter family protein n=1 Tax=Rhodotorula paludigena TaxID=86838 RepID=UPI00316EA05E
MSSRGTAILTPGTGYGIVVGVGLFFAALMIVANFLQRRYTRTSATVAEFSSASHSVKPFMVAAAVTSSWTWAASILTSASQAYANGIVGPYSYAAGAVVQILAFSANAAKIKLNAPNAVTFLEVLRARWGAVAHIVFMVYALITNILVTAMLVTGGSAVVTDLSGAHTAGVCMLIPVGVVAFVLVGGLRATFFADYLHVAFLFSVILAFQFVVFATSDKIGSPARLYDMLVEASARWPVDGNAEGSYLTFRSKSGIIFMIINLAGNSGTVFLDQSYWQRAIASVPSTASKGYFLGGTAWLSVPLGMAACLGLSGIALRTDPLFPTYPEGLSPAQVSAGLPAAAAVQVLMRESGAAVLLVLLFLAVTSTSAAELCAVSNILTHDIFRTYFRPDASDKTLIMVNRACMVGYGLFAGCIGVALYYAGISMGWLYTMMGILLGAAVVPVAVGIMWDRASKWPCVFAAIFGTSAGIIGWLVAAAQLNDGEVSVVSTGQDYPLLIGNLLSICLSAIIAPIGSLIFPERGGAPYDWAETRALHAHPEPTTVESGAPSATQSLTDAGDEISPLDEAAPVKELMSGESEKEGEKSGTVVAKPPRDVAEELDDESDPNHPKKIQRTFTMSMLAAVLASFILLVLIPMPLVGTGYISTKAGFQTYCIITIIWVFYGAFVTVIMPLVEYRKSLGEIFKHMWLDITRQAKY